MTETRSKRNAKRSRAVWTLFLILLILSAALLVALYLYAQAKLGRIDFARTPTEPLPTIDAHKAAWYGLNLPDSREEEEGDAALARAKKQVVNILLLGTDKRLEGTHDHGRADTTMLCSLNTATGAIKLVSFERGITVPIPGQEPDLLTHAYHWGGADLSKSLIEQCFLLDVAGWIQVDFEGFAGAIDAIGGIEVELTAQEAEALALETGANHLDGQAALRYCRLRSVDDDWMRQARQRNALTAAVRQLRSLSLSELNAAANAVMPLIHTNLSREQLSALLLHAPQFLYGRIEQLQVPDKNMNGNVISCKFDYESRKISNFLYGTDYEIVSPY